MLAVGGALRVVTLAGSPFTWVFQATWLAHFLTIPLLLWVMLLMLVVLPMHDAYTADQVGPGL